ncbi:chemotaxis protein CheC [candidate division WOR-3 bacterium]|nr:chemotaxis protein CheC [candidate division WOR-3 bacterium]MCK4526993.1 chemotaxis protein CheC [candidate division WOR-3 bacterium]
MKIRDLEEIQLDGIKEAANIGGGHAATALTQMLGREVGVEVPKITVVPIENTPLLLGEKVNITVAALTKFFGDVTGRNLLVMRDEDAKIMVNILLGRETTEDVVFEEMEASTLKEVANIITSSYISAISEFLGLMLLPTVPVIVRDDFRAIISSVYLEFSEDEEYVFCVETHFKFNEPKSELEAFLLLIPDAEGLSTMLKALKLL